MPAFNISVPEDLHKDVNTYKQQIQISAVCQEALRTAVKEEKAKKTDVSLVEKGANRLMKELKAPSSQDPADYYDACYQAGQEWAGDEASLAELKEVFETSYAIGDQNLTTDTGVTMLHFMNTRTFQSIPEEVCKKSEDSDHQLFFSFLDGAQEMWAEMKDLLEVQGYDIDEVKESDRK